MSGSDTELPWYSGAIDGANATAAVTPATAIADSGLTPVENASPMPQQQKQQHQQQHQQNMHQLLEAPMYLSPTSSRRSSRESVDASDRSASSFAQVILPLQQITNRSASPHSVTCASSRSSDSAASFHDQQEHTLSPKEEEHQQKEEELQLMEEEHQQQAIRQRKVESANPRSAERQQRQQQLLEQRLNERQSVESDCGCCERLLMCLSVVLLIATFPLSLLLSIRIVQQYDRAVVFRFGRVKGGPKGPGLFLLLPCIDSMKKVGLRTLTFNVPPQEILTRDSVTVSVDAVVYYRIYDPVCSQIEVRDAHAATHLLAQTSLRNILGTKTLQQLLAERDAIAAAMQSNLDDATESWGVMVERVEVKDVKLPVQLQRAMAAEAEAQREANAKVISAEGEQCASLALCEAGRVILQSPTAMQLRFLQSLNSVAGEKNHTVVFPLPMDLIQRLPHILSRKKFS